MREVARAGVTYRTGSGFRMLPRHPGQIFPGPRRQDEETLLALQEEFLRRPHFLSHLHGPRHGQQLYKDHNKEQRSEADRRRG